MFREIILPIFRSTRLCVTAYNGPILEVGNMSFTQGILRVVVTGTIVYRLDDKKQTPWP